MCFSFVITTEPVILSKITLGYIKIKTFEERLLTAEPREERKEQREEDQALAAYYRSISENNEPTFIVSENPEDDIWEDDTYIWDKDI